MCSRAQQVGTPLVVLSRQSMRKRDEQRELIRTAYHEAGHAVVAAVFGLWPYRATIGPEGSKRGEVRIRTTSLTFLFPPLLTAWLVYTLAGMEAQDRYSHRRIAWLIGGNDDIRSFVDDWARLHRLTKGKCKDHAAFERFTSKTVKQYWYAIATFARELLERRTLEDDDLLEALIEAIGTGEPKRPPDIRRLCPFDSSKPFGFDPADLAALSAVSSSDGSESL